MYSKMAKEKKEDRFIRVAEKRVQNVLNSLRSLSQLANKKVYQWDEHQIIKIVKAIEKEIEHCKVSFEDPDSKIFKL